jgi:hypothetical protein
MSFVARCIVVWLLIAAPWSLAQAATPVAANVGQLAANDTANPYNSPIRRINPNSRQGTEPLVPSSPAERQQVNPRPPTLQNGGIGNGQNIRPAPTAPRIEPTHPPRPTTP